MAQIALVMLTEPRRCMCCGRVIKADEQAQAVPRKQGSIRDYLHLNPLTDCPEPPVIMPRDTDIMGRTYYHSPELLEPSEYFG